jgi:RimJ/RimL family protein N-acetyltransferase
MLDVIINNIGKLKSPEGYYWEVISNKHSNAIVKWRNNPENLKMFYNQELLTVEAQNHFVDNYSKQDRIDFILMHKDVSKEIGVFSIKNISIRPELGKLIGEMDYRGKGLASKCTRNVLEFWFYFLNQNEIYAETKSNNTTNIKLNENLGFKIEKRKIVQGETFYIMRLLKEDFVIKK